MKRREFITLLGGAAATWPLSTRAQQGERMRRIGVLMNASEGVAEARANVAALREALQQLGWIAGGNIAFDVRWGGGDATLTARHAVELIRLQADVVVAAGAAVVAAIQRASSTIPVVFAQAIDPVGAGIVDSLARPGGSTTGFTQFEYGLSGKWPELVKEIAPRVKRVAVVRDSTNPAGIGQWAIIQASAGSLGMEVSPISVRARPRSGTDRAGKRAGGDPSAGDHRASRALPAARGLSIPDLRPGRRPDFLRRRSARPVPARRRVRRPYPQGRKTWGSAGAGTDQVRAGDQSQDRQSARPRSAADAARPRRRGDRIERPEGEGLK